MRSYRSDCMGPAVYLPNHLYVCEEKALSHSCSASVELEKNHVDVVVCRQMSHVVLTFLLYVQYLMCFHWIAMSYWAGQPSKRDPPTKNAIMPFK